MLLIECRAGGPYALLLPLIDGPFRTSIAGCPRPSWRSRLLEPADTRRQSLWAHIASGDQAVRARSARALYVAAGSDPFELLKRGFAEVAARSEAFLPLGLKRLPSSIGRLGWCTRPGDASGKVMAGLSALRDAGVPPRVLYLDDGEIP